MFKMSAKVSPLRYLGIRHVASNAATFVLDVSNIAIPINLGYCTGLIHICMWQEQKGVNFWNLSEYVGDSLPNENDFFKIFILPPVGLSFAK